LLSPLPGEADRFAEDLMWQPEGGNLAAYSTAAAHQLLAQLCACPASAGNIRCFGRVARRAV